MLILRNSKINSIVLFICGGCIGSFSAVRARGFLVLARSVTMPIWSLWVITLLFAVIPLIFQKKLNRYLCLYINPKSAVVYIIGLMSFLFCFVFRKLIIDKALSGSGVYPSALPYIMNIIGAALLLGLFTVHLWSAVKARFPSIRRWVLSLDRRDYVFLAALLIILNLLAWLYIKGTSIIYIWDIAGYWQITQLLAEAARHGIAHLLAVVYDSILTSDYNYLIALPWTPLVMLFGPSRWVFICGIINFGLFPVLVLIYACIKSSCKRKILATLCVICTFPMLMLTALVGYVDIVGVIFILLALLIWKADKNENDLNRFFIVGVLLAIAILLRRWFCFFALSFILTLVIDSLIYRKSAIPLIGTLTALCISVLFLFQPLVSNLLLKDYAQLYSAYQIGIAFDVRMFCNYFGLFTLAASVITGIYYCFKPSPFEHLQNVRGKRQTAMFLLLQMSICFVIFVRVQSHNQQHLLLYIPSLVVLMTMLVCPLADALTKRKAAGVLLAVNTVLPAVYTCLPALHPKQTEKAAAVSVLPNFTFKPVVWADAGEMVKIIRFLDAEVGSRGKTAGVLASSFNVNYDILINAESSLNLKRVSNIDRSYLLILPAVDSRDPFPGALFLCDYLLVADPVQLHLGKEKQQAVYLPAVMVLNGTGIGKAFVKAGNEFYINVGTAQIKLLLYEKIRDITDAEKKELTDAFNAGRKT